MTDERDLHLVWLSGPDCDGCTIKMIGDRSAGGIESLLSGGIGGLPPVALHHRILSPEAGDAFVERLRAAQRGEYGLYGIVVEASVPDEAAAGTGFFASLGEEAGKPITIDQWLDRLAPGAAFIVSWGDCAVWGGPHALAPNPSGSTGVLAYLGVEYRSTCRLPVINMPGCAPPDVLIATLASLLKYALGEADPIELDDLNRPRFAYGEMWKGAFVAWEG